MHKQIIKDLINQAAASINLQENWILGVFKKKKKVKPISVYPGARNSNTPSMRHFIRQPLYIALNSGDSFKHDNTLNETPI